MKEIVKEIFMNEGAEGWRLFKLHSWTWWNHGRGKWIIIIKKDKVMYENKDPTYCKRYKRTKE